MQGKMRFEFLSVEAFQGKKDPSKVYHNVSLLQGNEVVKSFLDDATTVLFEGLQKLDPIECDVQIKLSQNKFGANLDVKILSVQLLDEHGQPVLKTVKKSA